MSQKFVCQQTLAETKSARNVAPSVRREPLALLACVVALGLSACAPAPEAAPAVTGPTPAIGDGLMAHVLEEIAPGVYFADAAGTGEIQLTSNAMVVVNENDVLVVDSHITPDAARSLMRAVRTVSDKPIRYLVNTHFHFDHAHGNQSFPEGTEIIGHEYTRERLLGDVLNERSYLAFGTPEAQRTGVLAPLEELAAAAEGEEKQALEAQLTMVRRHIESLGEVEPTPPNTTLTEKMTLFRGGREIQLLHLGRGHTGGDVVVYLPAEKVVFTGDLLYASAPYLGDGYTNEFPQTLERLKALDVEIYVPGHGPLVKDKAQITYNQEYLRKYWSQVKASHDRGRSVAEAVAALDTSGYEQFAAFQLSIPAVQELEVRRMYELLEGAD